LSGARWPFRRTAVRAGLREDGAGGAERD